ncbi:dimethylsulfonioproprionate lyase family protein [Roseovarius sp. EL26]|uniref:dimethylsulfonioproprionate lyase family protein n=1 Tax=Roseovarius sp. EL26 TaxID=2126672 RepID=UPI000EA2C87F|nr:dimethylsulfonioproprionate lyase family protein [Roseovarius sp. EL26]
MDLRWETLLTETRATHARVPALQEFCALPEPVVEQPVTPHHIPAADLMIHDPNLHSNAFADFRDALINAAPLAQWRETYKGTGASADFLNRFACYEIIGIDAPFGATDIRAFVVYQPAGFHYPWHHHPAEEIYMVVAGEAEFHLEGENPQTLRPGDTAFHPSNAPHALITRDHPVMAYVLWRGDLNTKPVFTYPEDLS